MATPARKAPRRSNEGPSTSTPPRVETRKRRRREAISPQPQSPESARKDKSRKSRKRPRTETPVESPARASNSPDIDEDQVMSSLCIDTDNDESPPLTGQKLPRYRKRKSSLESPESPKHMDVQSTSFADDVPSNSGGSTYPPAHHSRGANPLVRVMSDEITMDGAIPTKSRLFISSSTEVATSRSTRSQTRYIDSVEQRNKTSTLLTVQKGKLISVKGKLPARNASQPGHDIERDPVESSEDSIHDYMTASTAPDGAAGPHIVSTAGDLLRLAGLNKDADDLEDYDEEAPASGASAPDADGQGASDSIFQQRCVARAYIFRVVWVDPYVLLQSCVGEGQTVPLYTLFGLTIYYECVERRLEKVYHIWTSVSLLHL